MARTNRFDPDVVERKQALIQRGKMSNRARSRRSALIRSIAESEREEAEIYLDAIDVLIDLEMGTL